MILSNIKLFLLDCANYAELDCDDVDFTTSFSVVDITDISQRRDNISKNIKLPASKNNNRALGNLFNLSRYTDSSLPEKIFYNYTPSRSVDCQMYENNTLIFKGDFRVVEVERDGLNNYTYYAVVTGALVNFFGKVGEDLLTDISGFDVLHNYNIDSIFTNGNIELSPQYLYPNIDYGLTGTTGTKDFNVLNYRTAIYLKTYLNNIFNHYGFTISGKFIDSEILKRAFIPYTEQDFASSYYDFLLKLTSDYWSYTFTAGNTTTYKMQSINFYNEPTGNTIYKSLSNYDGNAIEVFRFSRPVTTGGVVKIDFNATLTLGNGGILNMVVLPYDDRYGYWVVDYSNPYAFYSYTLTSANNHIGDSIEMKIPYQAYKQDTGFAVMAVLGDEYYDTSRCNLVVNSAEFTLGGVGQQSVIDIRLGDSVNLKNVIPQNIKVKDFLKSVLQFFNLYLIQNPENEKDWIIETFDVFYSKCSDPAQFALDWTDKVDYSSNTTITYNTNLPKKYSFKFKEDSDFYNNLYKTKYAETYGNFSIENSNGTADEKSIEVAFSPTVIARENNDDKTMPAIFKGDLNNKQPFKSNLRILFNNGYQTCQSYNIVSTTGNSQSIVYTSATTYNTSSHILSSGGTALFNLQFGLPKEIFFNVPSGNTLFNLPTLYSDFYKNQILELNDDNILNYEVDSIFNEVDISNLDMRLPVFIQNEDGASYFKILNIDYNNGKELSTVKLQKIVRGGVIEPEPIPIYYNDTLFGTFSKNDCNQGGTGSTVAYTISGGTYSAYTQNDADQLAIDDIGTNGQNYANSVGVCNYPVSATSFGYYAYYNGSVMITEIYLAASLTVDININYTLTVTVDFDTYSVAGGNIYVSAGSQFTSNSSYFSLNPGQSLTEIVVNINDVYPNPAGGTIITYNAM